MKSRFRGCVVTEYASTKPRKCVKKTFAIPPITLREAKYESTKTIITLREAMPAGSQDEHCTTSTEFSAEEAPTYIPTN